MPLIKSVNDTETDIRVTIDGVIDDAMCAMTTNVMLIRDSKLHGCEETF